MSFDDEECEWLLRGFLLFVLYEVGFICWVDDWVDFVLVFFFLFICGFDELCFIGVMLCMVFIVVGDAFCC